MINIFSNPLAAQFPIESTALPVYETPADNDSDVMSALANLIAENNKLEDLNTQLTKSRSDSPELKRAILDILPALDGFDRIIKLADSSTVTPKSVNNWIASMMAVHTKLLQSLSKVGLEPIQSMGQSVDFNLHDVIEYKKTDEYPHDTVIDEVRRGYSFRGKILREARVIVAYN